MAGIDSGLYTLREFEYRRTNLKLAPDAFVVVNGALSSRVLSPIHAEGVKSADMRGGITSINVNGAISPPGATRASITLAAPQYHGIHEDYYVTLPNGTRIPFFIPMMEVKIYMKGRYLEKEYGYVPQYYPVFWGMITSVSEDYSGGVNTITLSCEDFLVWWRFQQITTDPSPVESFFGGAPKNRFPSVFGRMSAWEIIYALFTDTFFVNHGKYGYESFYNFVYPKWSSSAMVPKSLTRISDTFGPLASNVISYWNKRFGFGTDRYRDREGVKQDLLDKDKIPLEMYGLRGPVSQEVVRDKILKFQDAPVEGYGKQANTKRELDLDFGMLAHVQPYGSFNNFGSGAESTVHTKLEIATKVCELTNMEFYVDMNGSFVFKPPFYNLDVEKGDVHYYRVGPEDIIDFNTQIDSNSICNYLTVTGPLYQPMPDLEAIGFHADFESIKRYGIRAQSVNVSYGMNASKLKMIAVAEMARRNGQAFTGSVNMPLRPEMRLGYPVYIEHIDTYYYVTGISHSFTFGTSATTTLTLQNRRERIFEDGSSGMTRFKVGEALRGCVMRDREAEVLERLEEEEKSDKKGTAKRFKEAIDVLEKEVKKREGYEDPQVVEEKRRLELGLNHYRKQLVSRKADIYEGPGMMGLWKLDYARDSRDNVVSDVSGNTDKIESNELLMITDKTVPYTDLRGYRHIGSFPYGANIVLTKKGMMDSTRKIDQVEMDAARQLYASGKPVTESEGMLAFSRPAGEEDTASSSEPSEYAGNYEEEREKMEHYSQQRNEQADPDIFSEDKKTDGLAAAQSNDGAAATQLNAGT